MNNNNNNITNVNIKSHHKGKIGFIIILFIIFLIILILVIRTTLNKYKIENKLIKNTWFQEISHNITPYNAWCTRNKNDDSYPTCKNICVKNKTLKKGIPNDLTHINGNYSLMFWFKIKKELFKGVNLNEPRPLLYFSGEEYSNNNIFGFFIIPYNNTMNIKVNDKTISYINNLPYDKWTCVTASISDKVIDIYINGRLLKTNMFYLNPLLSKKNLKWGPYPGELAFVEINNDPNELNAKSIYSNYKYYYNIINNYENTINNNDLFKNPFLNKNYKPLTLWDRIVGNNGNRVYNSICY